MESEIIVQEEKNFSPESYEMVKKLAQQLDSNFQPLSEEDYRTILASQSTHLYLARLAGDNKIVGMVSLVVYRIPYKMKAQLEDIVVDESVRGQGVGTILMNFAIEKAKELGVKSLNFTSRKEGAQKFYERLGFKKSDTNVYRLPL